MLNKSRLVEIEIYEISYTSKFVEIKFFKFRLFSFPYLNTRPFFRWPDNIVVISDKSAFWAASIQMTRDIQGLVQIVGFSKAKCLDKRIQLVS